MSVLELMPSRETKAEISVLKFYWDVLSGASLAREWRIRQRSWAERETELQCSCIRDPTLSHRELKVGMTLQRCPPNAQGQGFVSLTPPLTSHCSTALGEPVPSGQGHFKGRPLGGIQQTFPAALRRENVHCDPRQHTVSATTRGLQPPLCIVNGEKARSRTLTCRYILFCCCFFLTGITRNNIRVIIFRRKWGRGGR